VEKGSLLLSRENEIRAYLGIADDQLFPFLNLVIAGPKRPPSVVADYYENQKHQQFVDQGLGMGDL